MTTDDSQVHYVEKIEPPKTFTISYEDGRPSKTVTATTEGYYVVTEEDCGYKDYIDNTYDDLPYPIFLVEGDKIYGDILVHTSPFEDTNRIEYVNEAGTERVEKYQYSYVIFQGSYYGTIAEDMLPNYANNG